MKFFGPLLVWILMAAVLAFGVFKAVSGSPALLIVGVVAFFVAMGKIGCASH